MGKSTVLIFLESTPKYPLSVSSTSVVEQPPTDQWALLQRGHMSTLNSCETAIRLNGVLIV